MSQVHTSSLWVLSLHTADDVIQPLRCLRLRFREKWAQLSTKQKTRRLKCRFSWSMDDWTSQWVPKSDKHICGLRIHSRVIYQIFEISCDRNLTPTLYYISCTWKSYRHNIMWMYKYSPDICTEMCILNEFTHIWSEIVSFNELYSCMWRAPRIEPPMILSLIWVQNWAVKTNSNLKYDPRKLMLAVTSCSQEVCVVWPHTSDKPNIKYASYFSHQAFL